MIGVFNRKRGLAGLIIILSFGALVLGCSGSKRSAPTAYRNPLGGITGIGDPFVMKFEGKYYLYATSAPDVGYKYWESNDLVTWRYGGYALHKLDQPDGVKFGRDLFWAPEVIPYNGKFYMLYTVRDPDKLGHWHLRLVLAESSSPKGPFINVKAPLFNDEPYDTLDGNIFIDEDGTPYLYYVRGCNGNKINGKDTSQIFVRRLSQDLKETIGDAVLVAQPEKTWETPADVDNAQNEGPFVFKYEGKYYMTYSGNGFTSPDYSVGCATADNPMGPWTKYEEPILKKNLLIGVSGPGHDSFTLSPDNSELFIVYHAHANPNNPGGNRNLNIDRAYFENGILKINGPTRSYQPMPSKDSDEPLENIILTNVR